MVNKEVSFNGMKEVEKSVVYHLNPNDIYFDPEHNGRNATPDLTDLSQSIEEYGILQPLLCKVSDGKPVVIQKVKKVKKEVPQVNEDGTPKMDAKGKSQLVEEVEVEEVEEITVETPPAGTPMLVAGYSRIQAAMNIITKKEEKGDELVSKSGADLSTVPVVFVENVDSKGTLLLNIEENVRRNNLSPMDVYANIVRLREEHNISDWKELTKIFGRSRAWVEQHQKLGENLSPKIQRKVHSGEIPWSVAQKMVDLDKPEQEELIENIKKNGEPITRDNVVKAKRNKEDEKPETETKKYQARTTKQIKDYFTALQETENESGSGEGKRGQKMLMLCEFVLDFCDGKLSDRQMDNRLNKLFAA